MKVTLYVAKYCPYSLRARIALAEKKMAVEVVESGDLSPEMLKKVSPNGKFPVLQEKGYAVNNKKALMLYIDERFPAPALLPNLVQEKIKVRLALEKIDNEWYSVLEEVKNNRGSKVKLKTIFKNLKESLLAMERVFADTDYFLTSSFTLADCSLAAMMLYLEAEGFAIDESFGAIYEYKNRVLTRDSVKKAYTKGGSQDSLLKALRR